MYFNRTKNLITVFVHLHFLTIQSCHDNSLIKYIVDNILKLLVGRDGHEEKAKPVEVAFGGGGIFWPIIKCSEFLV